MTAHAPTPPPAIAPVFANSLVSVHWRALGAIHWCVPATLMQPWVPATLELHQGHAWVSAIAVQQRAPLTHRLQPVLALRAAVLSHGRPASLLLAAWCERGLLAGLARWLGDLPLREAQLRIEANDRRHQLLAADAHGGGALSWTLRDAPSTATAPAEVAAETEAFLWQRGDGCLLGSGQALGERALCIERSDLVAAPARWQLGRSELLAVAGPWWRSAQPVLAHRIADMAVGIGWQRRTEKPTASAQRQVPAAARVALAR